MPRKTNSTRSRIKNLRSKAQKRPSVTIEDVEGEMTSIPSHLSLIKSKEHLGEAYIIDEDGTLTLVGFLDLFYFLFFFELSDLAALGA